MFFNEEGYLYGVGPRTIGLAVVLAILVAVLSL
jgi:hypothetical protein